MITFAVGLASCSHQTLDTHGAGTNSTIEEIAQAELGKDFSIEYNGSGSYALCHQKETSGVNKYILVLLADKKITHRGQFRPGYIKWIDNNSIEVLDAPGMLRKDQELSDFKKTITVGFIEK